MMPLLEEPITKEQFERELLSLPPKEADSRSEFWTLCEALQAMEDTKCPPPNWFIESFKKVLEYASEERAEPWRESTTSAARAHGSLPARAKGNAATAKTV